MNRFEWTHDLMVRTLETMYPGKKHGPDFIVGVPVGPNGKQAGNPLIMQWKGADPEPKYADVYGAFKAQERSIREADARSLRDDILRNTDQFAHAPPDAPDAVRAKAEAWLAYREALRALPEQPGFPFDIDWPLSPA